MRKRIGRIGLVVAVAAVTAVAMTGGSASASSHGSRYQQDNLVSDQAGKAVLTDPNLVNPWGMSHGGNTPIWVSDNGADVSTLYRGATGPTPVSKVALTVSIPGGAPTGQIFNDTTSFVVPGTTSPALFAFAGEDGDLSAWNGSVSPSTQAVSVGHTPNAVYKGLALDHSPFGPLLLAANFHDNRIDVFNGQFQLLSVPGLFTDPRLPRGYAPFNVAEINGKIFVTYAKQDAQRHDDVAGAGHGFIDVYTTYGVLVDHFASRGVLNSPWGLTIAPSTFGQFAGDLLVGNFGDGRIHAFNPYNGRLLGTLRGLNGRPLAIDGLWGLLVGDAAAGGPDAVWFSAGPDGEAHGLLGILSAH